MRRGLLGALLLAALTTGAQADELRIVFVNSEVILQQYKAVESVVETFNRDVQGWNEEALRQKNALEEMQREFESQSLMLSEERRHEKELDYQRRLGEYEKFVQSIWGPDGLVEQRNEELLRPIINKVQALLAKLAVEEEYDFILDAADNNILYADPEFDITADVIGMLNTEESGD
jgi:outer membrane protein